MIAMKGKGFGLGEFINCTDFDIPQDSIWYSIDADSYNFHIVPDKEVKTKSEELLEDWLVKYKKKIRKKLDEIKIKDEITINPRGGKGSKDCTRNHQWIEAYDKEYTYLLVFNRLWHKNNVVNNSFGKIQFMCYPKSDDEQINRFKTEELTPRGNPKYEFKMTYPNSDEKGLAKIKIYRVKEQQRIHCVYNPSDFIITDDSDIIEDIAKEFLEFIIFSKKLR